MILINHRHIIRNLALLPVFLIMLVLVACGHEADPANPSVKPDEQPEYSVKIRISTGLSSGTRATLPEIYGSDIENTIDINNLKILVFDNNGILKDIWFRDGYVIGNVQLLERETGYYELRAKLDKTKYSPTEHFSIVVLANWNSLEEFAPVDLTIGSTTYETLANKTYLLNRGSNLETWIPADDSLIPMFGVLYADLSGYSDSEYSESSPMNVGTINLIRALSKIEIVDNESHPDVEITSIELTKRNTRGHLTPEIIDDKTNTHQVEAANIPTDPNTDSTVLRLRKIGNKYVAYVPEMTLGETLESRMSIDVNLKILSQNGIVDTRKIAFAPYSDGKPTLPASMPNEWKALLRNHIYRFYITTINIYNDLDLVVDVQPFSSVTLNPDFGLERTEDGYIVVRDANGNITMYIRPDGAVLTFKEDNRWPYLGKFMGVFDDSKRVLIGYFIEGKRTGKSIIFNYASDQFNEENIYENLQSWGIYSQEGLKDSYGNVIPEHLEETFFFKSQANVGVGGGLIKGAYTHTTLDHKSRVIEEYCYASLEDFQHHEEEGTEYQRIRLAEFEGERYGDKVITYYDATGQNIICRLTVTGDTESYEYF